MRKPLPIGVDNFEKLISNHYYYVDKTLLIRDLIDLKGEVNLFTRPRRFGKTLNLSMLRYFFEDTGDERQNEENRRLFEGLKIMEAGNAYTSQMGQYPVINLTLKSAKQNTFESAYYKLRAAIAAECERHSFLLESPALSDSEKRLLRRLTDQEASYDAYSGSLQFLSRCLFKASGKKVIILIDEYDVPLESSYFEGFYEKMINFIRSLFESALKTNDYLAFAVITGCLRISKESIFTGLNHLRIISILDKQYSEHFGFTVEEVKEMMAFYDCVGRYDTMELWYDGYSFGNTQVYNPWSVINFMYDLSADKEAFPRPYWGNTSSNEILRRMVRRAGRDTREQMENLLAGKTMDIKVHEEITYGDIEANEENLWNFLYFTGYLTKRAERFEEDVILLRACIPNTEVKSIYKNTILTWFQETIKKQDFRDFYCAMEAGDTEKMTSILNGQLQSTISFYDSAENFYHGFMAGILSQSSQYIVKSNRESGSGRNDLMIYSPDIGARAFVLELKVASRYRELEHACQAALEQIRDRHYTEYLEDIGYEDIVCYGIGFFRKNCRILREIR